MTADVKEPPMLPAFLRGLTVIKERVFWRVVRHCLLITTAAFITLYVTVWVVLTQVSVADLWWLDTLVDVLGGLAVLVLTWLLFPAVATVVLSLFIEHIVTAVEKQYYPLLPALRALSIRQTIAVALKFTTVMVALNLLMLPLYLVPVLNVLVFYGLNVYLLGREYFELVALRRLDPIST
jgi:CysZ protein